MIFPWTSRIKLQAMRDRLQDELATLREAISARKAEIKAMEKELYWGEVSLSEMKAQRKDFVAMQERIRRVKKRLRALDAHLGTKVRTGSETPKDTGDEREGDE